MRWSNRFLTPVAAVLFVSPLAGCIHVPPRTVNRDRIEYGQSVADSWKRQMLLNVVRLRYGDAPIFMDVTTVINSYSVSGSASAGALFTDPNEFPFAVNGSFSNTPTVTYQPLTGDRFMKSLLRPIPPASVFQMLQSGWSAELPLRISVSSVNGLANQSLGRAADPRFDQLLNAVSRLQAAGNLHIRVEERKEGEAVVVALPVPPGGSISADRAEVQRLLGLDPAVAEYTLTYGLVPRSSTEIAVLTRSMLEIMLEYGFGIDVPAADQAEGRVNPGRAPATGTAPDAGTIGSQMVHVRSGAAAPRDAYSSVFYRGRWFWIDDRELASKVRFTFLMILSSLAETGVEAAMPVVTIPGR